MAVTTLIAALEARPKRSCLIVLAPHRAEEAGRVVPHNLGRILARRRVLADLATKRIWDP